MKEKLFETMLTENMDINQKVQTVTHHICQQLFGEDYDDFEDEDLYDDYEVVSQAVQDYYLGYESMTIDDLVDYLSQYPLTEEDCDKIKDIIAEAS